MTDQVVSTHGRDPASASQDPVRRKLESSAALTLLLLSIIYGVQYLDQILVGLFAQAIKTDFKLTDTEVGLLTGVAFTLFYAVLGFPLARLADRWNRKYLIVVSVALFSAATLACGLAAGFAALFIARICVAVGEAGTMPAAVSILADRFTGRGRRMALALHSSGGFLGTAIGLLLVGLWTGALTWRGVFIGAGGAGLLLAVALSVGLRNPDRQTPLREPSRLFDDARAMASNTCYLLMAAGLGVGSIASAAAINWSPAFLARSHGLPQRQTILFMACAWGLGATSGSVAFGFLTTWLQRRGGRWPLMAVALPALIYPVAFCLAFAAPSTSASMIGIAAGLFLMGGVRGPVFATVQDVIPPHLRATAAALLMFSMYAIGVTLGPLLTGVASDALAPQFGRESLRYGLFVVVLSTGILASLLFATAGMLLSSEVNAEDRAASAPAHLPERSL